LFRSDKKEIIKFQIGLIRKELNDTEPLLKKVKLSEPDEIEIRAIGSVLQTFYNGIESILATYFDKNVFIENNWHQRVLEESLSRGVIDESLFLSLDLYRKFRHKFRHSYGFMLRWNMMEPLVSRLSDVFNEFIIKATHRND
jgi:hypothetical protein